MYTMHLDFFVFANCYQRRVLAIRVTMDGASMTRLVNTRHSYFHISDMSSQYALLLCSHQWRIFSIHVAAIFTSVMRLYMSLIS